LKAQRKIRRKSEQSGIALLLAIFVLLLVCVVGIAMLAASGTETSLSGNYRSSTATYYAAMSGLEEGRARLLPQYPSPNSLNPTYVPAYGTNLPLGHAIYITNPVGGETVDPTALGNPDEYPDTEWATEFPGFNPPSSVQIVPTVTNLAGSPNAAYKWVRINALTEQAIQIDVNNTNPGGGTYNTSKIIYFDGTNLTRIVAPYQALGVTALAALPDGSRKLLRYVVGPVTLQLPIVAALTLEGPGGGASIVTFNQPPVSPYTFQVNGNDQAVGSNPGLACSIQPSIPAIGVLDYDDWNYLGGPGGALTSPSPGKYMGQGGSTPNISPNPYVHPSNSSFDLTNPVQLASLVKLVQNSADTVVTGPASEADMPGAMSFANPQTVVVNGDLTLNGYTGYGLLLVTGKLTYSGDSGWKGIVLVIGQGVVEETGSANTGEIDGAVFVANINSGHGIPALGPSSYTAAQPGGKGIYYNSCWVAKAQKPISYKILSFREIPYP
jgi:hypothetical protein